MNLMIEAKITAPKPMTNPTDKSMPPDIITSVWPRPKIRGAEAKIKILWRLNLLNKKVDEYSILAQVSKKITIMSKKAHDHKDPNILDFMMIVFHGGIIIPPMNLNLVRVNEFSDFGIVYIRLVHDCKTSAYCNGD